MECFKYVFNILNMTDVMLKTNNSGNIRNKKNASYQHLFNPLGVYTFTCGMTCYRGGLGLPRNATSHTLWNKSTFNQLNVGHRDYRFSSITDRISQGTISKKSDHLYTLLEYSLENHHFPKK